jgi:CBS domain-containing protein
MIESPNAMRATVTVPSGSPWRCPPVSIDPVTMLRRAARELDDEDIGAVVALGPDGLAGLLSERDIVRALARGADSDVTSVDSVMTEGPLSVDADTPIEAVADLMGNTGVRHLPVVTGHDVVGQISIRDVLDVAAGARPRTRTPDGRPRRRLLSRGQDGRGRWPSGGGWSGVLR